MGARGCFYYESTGSGCLQHFVKLGVELGFDLVLEHGGQKAELGLQAQLGLGHVQLAFNAITFKVQHVLLVPAS